MEKHIIEGKVRNWAHKIFTVEKVASSEQGVVVQFNRAVTYRVVKLDVSDLPAQDTDGTNIQWLTNFAVVNPQGQYVQRVNYTVFLPDPGKGAEFVYYDDRGLRRGKAPKAKGTQPAQPGMVQIDFDRGDPGIGLRGT